MRSESHPFFAASRTTLVGNSFVRSRSVAPGLTRASANERASARSASSSGVSVSSMSALRVVVEAAPRLLSEMPRVDQPAEERAGAVPRIAEALLEDFEDRQADVQSDEVRQRERPHRMVHSELHDLVDRFLGGDSLHQREG